MTTQTNNTALMIATASLIDGTEKVENAKLKMAFGLADVATQPLTAYYSVKEDDKLVRVSVPFTVADYYMQTGVFAEENRKARTAALKYMISDLLGYPLDGPRYDAVKTALNECAPLALYMVANPETHGLSIKGKVLHGLSAWDALRLGEDTQAAKDKRAELVARFIDDASGDGRTMTEMQAEEQLKKRTVSCDGLSILPATYGKRPSTTDALKIIKGLVVAQGIMPEVERRAPRNAEGKDQVAVFNETLDWLTGVITSMAGDDGECEIALTNELDAKLAALQTAIFGLYGNS